MNGMIFAAGLGTRLRPLTEHCPKAMVRVKGKPLLEYVIRKMVDVGVKRVVVNVHHLAEQIIAFVENNDFGADVVISDERDCLLNTGGGLKKAKDLFIPGQPILIHNADIFSNFDINKLVEGHIASDALATLLVRKEYGDRAFLQYNGRLTGWRNFVTGEEKPANDDYCRSLPVGFTGIHIVAYEMLGMIIEDGVFSIVDLYLRLAKEGYISIYEDDSSLWMDLGTCEQLERARELF